MHTIAIIGAGFSGTLVAVHLLRQTRTPVRILLIDRTGAFGPGLAYGNGSESLLLNVVAGRMSALPDEPTHFLRWAHRQDPAVRGETFLPRRLYGRYLADLLESAQQQAAEGTLERLADDVIDVIPGRTGVRIARRGGEDLRADAVVLAPGNAAPARPDWCDSSIQGAGRYIADPWRNGGLTSIGPQESVLIIGTGLTMMDVALALNEAGHRGTIDAVSRRGLLPQPHRHGNPGLARLPDPLFRGTFSNLRDLLHFLRTEAESAEARGGDWRDAVNAMRSITPSLWKALEDRERRRFLDHLLPFWNSHRHRAPPSVADGVGSLIKAGRVRIHAARIVGVRASGAGLDVDVRPRGAESVRSIRADRIVNCTGPAMEVRHWGDALVDRLLQSGLVRPGPLGMGLDFDDEGCIVRADGRALESVFLIGPARAGRLWEATAAPELRVQAADLARRLVHKLALAGPTNGVQVPGARTGVPPG